MARRYAISVGGLPNGVYDAIIKKRGKRRGEKERGREKEREGRKEKRERGERSASCVLTMNK
jgi:hypothetical protein